MTDPSESGRATHVNLVIAGVFVLVAALAAVDLAADLREGTTLRHLLLEGLVAAVGITGAGWMGLRARALAREARHLRAESAELSANLAISRAEAARWRGEVHELIAGLSSAIDAQLVRWELTAAEREIALLLLKGLSHKEIADIRQVSESTVRQQARAIYRKAGLGGRHDLAAFFLEDLLGPRAP